MDTSKEYIKMCEKAEEIQKFKKDNPIYQCKPGDFFKENTPTGGIIVFQVSDIMPNTAYDDVKWIERKLIWLPRQDQLREMMLPDLTDPFGVKKICKFVLDRMPTIALCIHSWEQVLLLIIMEENYHKIWKGEDWVERNDS